MYIAKWPSTWPVKAEVASLYSNFFYVFRALYLFAVLYFCSLSFKLSVLLHFHLLLFLAKPFFCFFCSYSRITEVRKEPSARHSRVGIENRYKFVDRIEMGGVFLPTGRCFFWIHNSCGKRLQTTATKTTNDFITNIFIVSLLSAH